MWTNFTESVGDTVIQYQEVLAENATYLSEQGEYTNDVARLLTFELLQAGNFGAIAQRFQLDAFGYGRIFPWSYSLTEDEEGNVTITTPSKSSYTFILQDDGAYFSVSDIDTTLTKVNNNFQFEEANGSKLTFNNGKIDYIDDIYGNRTDFSYTNNRLTQIQSSNGENFVFNYNNFGRISETIDNKGDITTYEYDSTGNYLLEITTSDGNSQSYSYITEEGASQNAISTITYSDGNEQQFEYDNQGRLVRESLNDGSQFLTYTYDSTGGVTVTDINGGSSKVLFNDRGQVAKIEDSLGKITELNYDANGNLIRTTDADNNISSFNYDTNNNLISQIDPLGNQTNLRYNDSGVLEAVIDPRGNPLSFERNNNNDITKVIYADGTTENFGYNSKGLLNSYTNRRNQTIEFTHDDLNLIITKTYDDGTKIEYSYDDRGNLISATDATGVTTQTYDSNDRLTSITYPNGRSISYTYDNFGRRTSIKTSDNFTINNTYNEIGQLVRVSNGNDETIVNYSYDNLNRLQRKDKGNGTYTTYSYNLANQRLSLVNHAPDDSVNSRFDYSYDNLGRPIKITSLEGSTEYKYNANNQLTSVKIPTGRIIEYKYDQAGNRISVIDDGVVSNYNTNNLNQYTARDGTIYQYDADGNLIAEINEEGTSTYTYDQENRVKSKTTPEGNWEYEYNVFGNRTAVIENGVRTEYLIDPTGLGNNIIGEYDFNDNLLRSYAIGAGLEASFGADDTPYYYDFDAQGSTVGLSNPDGNYVNTYSYLPSGKIVMSNEVVDNPFKYGGQLGVTNESNGLNNTGTTLYNPENATTSKGNSFLETIGNGFNNTINGIGDIIGSGFNNTINYLADISDATKPSGDIYEYQIFNGLLGLAGAVLLIPAIPAAVASGSVAAIVGVAGLAFYRAYQIAGSIASIVAGANGKESIITGSLFADILGLFGEEYKIFGQAIDLGLGNFAAGTKILKIPETLNNILDISLAGKDLLDSILTLSSVTRDFIDNLFGKPPELGEGEETSEARTQVLTSFDPNDVVGPAGFGEERWIEPQPNLPYIVRFENDAEEADVPAVFVTITHQLDEDLDWTTFELGNFGFGDYYVEVPDGLQNYSTRVDTGETLNGDVVDFEAKIDVETGLVTWILRTIDPQTNDLPMRIDAGFLPPNNEDADGEGFVSYTIDPKPELTTGTELNAEASIVFDINEPIETPLWTNTIDVDAPTSNVEELPAITYSTEFTVTWSGTDLGSGIASYDVYVAVDDGDFTLWLDDTIETSAIFTGVEGLTYQFYSVAKDNVGYVESAPTEADTLTTVQTVNRTGLDIDGNGEFDALTDGIMAIRYMFGGFEGDDLINGAIAPDATRDLAGIQSYLQESVDSLYFDIDGNGTVDALSDGIIAIRHLFGGFDGNALIDGAIAPDATRDLAGIQSYLAELTTII